MKHSLPILTILSVIVGWWMANGRDGPAATDRAPVSSTDTDAERKAREHLARAIDRIAMWPHLAARLRQSVTLFGRSTIVTGTYHQAYDGRNLRFRLDLRAATEPIASHFLEVSDGRFLWTRRDLPGEASLTRVDLLEAARQLAPEPAASAAPPDWMTVLAGGLPAMLARWREAYVFRVVRQVEIGQEKLPAVVLEGRLKEPMAAQLVVSCDSRSCANVRCQDVPPPIPHELEIVLGLDKPVPGFPYQIRGYRIDGDRRTQVFSAEWFELVVEGSPAPYAFRFSPGNEEVSDETDAYVAKVRDLFGDLP